MTAGEFWRRLHFLLNRSRFERELHEEMETHRAMRADASARFGNIRSLREESADIWGWGWWDRLRQDVTFGWRMMRKSPAFTLTAVAVLAIGAGVNIAAFQLLDAVTLAPLPVREPDSLVRFYRRSPDSKATSFSYPAVTFYSAQNHTLSSSLAAVHAEVALDTDATRHASVHFVSPNYLSELGATTAAGRLLIPADGGAAADPVVVLSESLWRSRFGGDPAMVGRTLRINSRPVTVVGVASSTFWDLTARAYDAWMPISALPHIFPGGNLLTNVDDNPVTFFGRLKPGVTRAAAQADLSAVAVAMRGALPAAAWEHEFVEVVPAGRYAALPEIAAAASIAGALTGIVLLAACANLGTLLLGRGIAREREFSVRLSVGASRQRLVRQLMTESVMLAVAGTLAGTALSFIAARVLLATTDAPPFLQPRLDLPLVAFSMLIAAAAAALAGLPPAFQSVKPAATRARARGLLVGVQVATGCTLLVVAGLLVRGVDRVLHTPLGFEYASHVTVDPSLSAHGLQPHAARAYWRQFEDRAAALPAVRAVALVTLPPLGNRAATARSPRGVVYFNHVEPSYFAAMRIPVLRGRLFTDREPGVAVVSDSFARVMWPDEDAVGKTYDSATVVGIVGNAPTVSLGTASATEFYRPMDDEHIAQAVLVVSVDGDPAPTVTPLADIARAVDARSPATIEMVRDSFARKLQAPEQASVVISILGVTALALGAVGFAGLIGFTVSQRLREIGVRLALGARRRDIVRALLGQFARPLTLGVLGGLACASAFATVLRAEFFGLNPFDPVSYVTAVAVFIVTGMLAATGPIRRALRVDPVSSLRCD